MKRASQQGAYHHIRRGLETRGKDWVACDQRVHTADPAYFRYSPDEVGPWGPTAASREADPEQEQGPDGPFPWMAVRSAGGA